MDTQREFVPKDSGHSGEDVEVHVWRVTALDPQHLGVRDPHHRSESPGAQPSDHASLSKLLAGPTEEPATAVGASL